MREQKPRRKPQQQNDQLPMFDQEMRAAKNNGRVLTIYLPGPTSFTNDEDNSFEGVPEFVDKFAVKFAVIGPKNIKVWVPKQDMIVQL